MALFYSVFSIKRRAFDEHAVRVGGSMSKMRVKNGNINKMFKFTENKF